MNKIKSIVSYVLIVFISIQCGNQTNFNDLSITTQAGGLQGRSDGPSTETGSMELSNPNHYAAKGPRTDGHHELTDTQDRSFENAHVSVKTTVSYDVKDGVISNAKGRTEWTIARFNDHAALENNPFGNYFQTEGGKGIFNGRNEVEKSTNKLDISYDDNGNITHESGNRPSGYQGSSGGEIEGRERPPGIGGGPPVFESRTYPNKKALEAAAAKSKVELKSSLDRIADSSRKARTLHAEKLNSFVSSYNANVHELKSKMPGLTNALPMGTAGENPIVDRIRSAKSYLNFAKQELNSGSWPGHEHSQKFVEMAESALNLAEQKSAEGDYDSAEELVSVAETALDIALSLTPVVGWAKDVYEVFTGLNLITGEELSKFEYGMAILGAVSGGILSKMGKTKLAVDAYEGLIKNSKGLSNELQHASNDILENFIKPNWHVKIVKTEKIEIMNDSFKPHPKYDSPAAGRNAKHLISDRFETFIRTYEGNNRVGSFMARYSSIKGLTPAQIRQKFALELTPTHFTKVSVPPGTIFRGSLTAEQPKLNAVGGGWQYDLIQRLDTNQYSEGVPIGEIFN